MKGETRVKVLSSLSLIEKIGAASSLYRSIKLLKPFGELLESWNTLVDDLDDPGVAFYSFKQLRTISESGFSRFVDHVLSEKVH